MQRITQILTSAFVAMGLFAVVGGSTTLAIDPLKAGCDANQKSEICAQTKGSGASVSTTIKNIISLLLFVLGVICVIVIIVAGIQYAVAAGDSNQITRAKNSILYAIVGLVIALLAYTIVNFVIDQFR